VLIGLLPLLVVGAGVVVLLAVRFTEAAAPVREATGRAEATVVRSGLGADRREVQLRWTDDRGVERTSVVRAATAGAVPAGSRVELRYVPGDPTRVYVGGDEVSARLRDLSSGIFLTALLLAVVVSVTAVHIARRLSLERRPPTVLPVTYARSRRALVRRSWLVVEDAGREHWVPVHWEPVLTRLLAGTPVPVHGRPSRDRVVVADVEGIPVWQAGRRRLEPPRGEVVREAPEWSRSAERRAEAEAQRATTGSEPVGLARQFRIDGSILVAAPLVGLLWAYADRGGLGSAAVATLLAACFLFWLPTITGSDPT
jgi:hypothetical protein